MKKIIFITMIMLFGCTTTPNRPVEANLENDEAIGRTPAATPMLPPTPANGLETKKPFLGNSDIDVEHYHIQATIKEMPPKDVFFLTEITLKTLTATNVVQFHTQKSAYTVKAVQLNHKNIHFGYVKGIGNAYALDGDVINVYLPKTTAINEEVKLLFVYSVPRVDFVGGLMPADDRGLFYIPAEKNFGKDMLITRNWPYYARYWLPSNDSPDDGATVSYDIRVPPGYIAAANGKQTNSEPTKDGLVKFEWSMEKPTTTYDFVFTVSKFDVFQKDLCFNNDHIPNDTPVDCATADTKIPVVLYYNKDNKYAQKLIDQLNSGVSAAEYFSKFFGTYNYEKVGFVLSRYPFAMESTSLIVLRFDDNSGPGSAVHEVIHHWWGNNVHFDHWGNFWISEGFTSYFTGFFDEYRTTTNSTCLSNTTDPLNLPAETSDPNDAIAAAIVNPTLPPPSAYCKGAMALHDLRVRLARGKADNKGTLVFLNLMKGLYSTYTNKTMSTTDLVSYIDANLAQAFQDQGITVPQAAASAFVQKWQKAWFVQPAPQK